ncbi:MAG TPA: hypothetical protein VKY37_13035 [Brumimicrobium sp.]|nr:hypothetical protein [Brumimicrobium sp.]
MIYKSIQPQKLILVVTLLFAFMFISASYGQEASSDSTASLSSFLKKGELNFHSRTYLMSTLNKEREYDFFTLATGAGINYKTPSIQGFQIKAGGYLSFRLAEYNLIDSETERWNKNRYEKALYDINDTGNKYNLGILDEVYLSYKHKGLSFKLGRQTYETPLLNKNYNRMRPNFFQGLSAQYENKNLTFSGAWFISEGIRATTDTYSMANSIGVYGQGRNTEGIKSDYHGHTSSLGTGVFGMKYNKNNWKTQAWNYLAENVFNTTFIQSDYAIKKNKTTFSTGIQGFYQTALNNGGNSNPTHSYMLKGEQTYAIGGMAAIMFNEQHLFSFNYLGISDQGRFLFPKEWGREQFYASQTTELFEGYGGVNAYVLRYNYNSINKQHKSKISAGVIEQPEINDFRLNKYSLDSYYHFLVEHKYHFGDYLKGLSLRFIATYKKEVGEGTMTAAQKINKVDMINLNLVIDYKL